MAVEVKAFGKSLDGKDINLYSLKNSKGMEAVVTNLGGIIVNLFVPDKNGKVDDVVLGYDKVEDYFKNASFFGAVIGPSANRIGGASFSINGETYNLPVNDGPNNLHSDFAKGYHKLVWDVEVSDNAVTFTLEDTDGNMGFPGNKKSSITYSVDEENGLTLHYHGTSDKKTILNYTNHTYFNLDGHDCGDTIEGHVLQLNAACYTPVVPGAIPTGEIASVKGTPMDFTSAKAIGKEIGENFEQLLLTQGYDHNWVLDNYDGSLRLIATAQAPVSGRIMKTYTTLPGVQFYAGNNIAPTTGKNNTSYKKRSGFCLETQFYPDTIHHDNFPGCVFGEDSEYDSVTVYRFE